MIDTIPHIENLESNETLLPPFADLVLLRVRLLAQRRIAWLRKIWAEAGNGKNVTTQFDYHAEVDGYLFDLDALTSEQEWLISNDEFFELSVQLKETENSILRDHQSRLNKLRILFGLRPAEMDILQICFALSVDANLSRILAYLHDHSGRGYITGQLAARLFGYGRCLPLHSGSPVFVWGLITEISTGNAEPSRFEIDPFIKNWLLGLDGNDESLMDFITIQPVKSPLGNWPVQKAVALTSHTILAAAANVRVIVSGAPNSGRRTFAAVVAQQLGMQLLTVDITHVQENRWRQIYMRTQRQALLNNYAVAWYGKNLQQQLWPKSQIDTLQFIITETADFASDDTVIQHHVEIPALRSEERRKLWEQFLPAGAQWPKDQWQELMRRPNVTIGQITSVGRERPDSVTEVFTRLQLDAQNQLGELAQHMICPFTWDDLVVSDWIQESLEEFIYEGKDRVEFWERKEAQRLFPQGKNLIALFTGPSGTGKTMAAQVVAAGLNLDLFRIDLSTVVSKYVGESSKNIEQILSRAKRLDIVLFFDEADALFGKRTEINDAHDRFANTDTNYLLQAIEQYPGIVIMASNKKSNIDGGFMRRLRYLLEFPKPDANHRFELWKRILYELAGKDWVSVEEKDLNHLAELLDITGAQIKLAILSAMFAARRDNSKVTLVHLIKGLERELVKDGRGLGKHLRQTFNT